jgi:hypothetical protein
MRSPDGSARPGTSFPVARHFTKQRSQIPGGRANHSGRCREQIAFLSLIVGDLSGAYNEIGIRQWFERKRAQLGGRTPLDWLKTRWKPTQPGPRRVQDLARALVASPAT